MITMLKSLKLRVTAMFVQVTMLIVLNMKFILCYLYYYTRGLLCGMQRSFYADEGDQFALEHLRYFFLTQ